ncbi:maleylpyruvate isomerase family mycothiol-dependent enzyme [Intrasporangium calvum]|uniref:Maleylpyruvate isomerase family mycothiol-dependent enzyme n=1 Tax=Intrasporangium calvum TaxID=53358 RepID=A0ABT5GCR0_9MICO|nr:maleylpyruvate isomerase family mycothiol-dependent enzyme [Intrasporangium calvum]MDC5695852.1 maleylpyruvate isomerase family mycothiol-dependent enzyme [Intrasporangium calvum]
MHLIDLSTRHLPRETERLVETAQSLSDADVRAASLCAGWTRGHVLSHLARNAEALTRVCTCVLTGEADTMYDSSEARDADIEAGAGREAAALAEDVRSTAALLAPEIAKVGVQHVGTTVERVPGGQLIAAERVPFMRLREVVWHHVDLDAGYTFESAPDELVHLFLEDMVARLGSSDGVPGLSLRTDEGDEWTVGDGETKVTGPRHGVLLWLARGRTEALGDHSEPLPRLPFGG